MDMYRLRTKLLSADPRIVEVYITTNACFELPSYINHVTISGYSLIWSLEVCEPGTAPRGSASPESPDIES